LDVLKKYISKKKKTDEIQIYEETGYIKKIKGLFFMYTYIEQDKNLSPQV